jgi:hypothetical protein
MGASGNPAKKAAAKKTAKKTVMSAEPVLSSPEEFKKRKKGRLLPLPSGLVARVRRVELQSYVLRGDIPNPLMATVSEALEKGQQIDMSEVLDGGDGQIDLEKLREMYDIVDGLMTEMFVEPKLYFVPEDEADRDDDLLYTDELEEDDKMFLFQWAMGGTEDLATFRDEAEQSLVALGAIQGGGMPAK